MNVSELQTLTCPISYIRKPGIAYRCSENILWKNCHVSITFTHTYTRDKF